MLSVALQIGMAAYAQISKNDMENQAKTIRLVYPQWQGGDIAHWITEVKDPEQASRGYYLGAQLLNFLAPDNGQATYTVPVATDIVERKVTDGVMDKEAIIAQTKAALGILNVQKPDKIVTLGGECSASVVPFTYLNKRYDGDVAMIWIDAHPDITLPGDVYAGYHAMAVTACMGIGDRKIIQHLPSSFSPSRILFAGIRDWERDEIRKRHDEYGIGYFSPDDIRNDPGCIGSWLDSCGASKAVVHFDMDVLDPDEIVAAVGTVPEGLLIDEAVDLINAVASRKDLVGLTVAEPIPRTAKRLRSMLRRLPLMV